MADNSFLLDDLDFDYNTLSASPMMRMGTMSADDLPDIPGGSDGDGMATNNYSYSLNTNLLWLEMVSITNGLANARLHRGTNQVYAIWGTTNLLVPFTNWEVQTEVWPTNSSQMPFSVSALEPRHVVLAGAGLDGRDRA